MNMQNKNKFFIAVLIILVSGLTTACGFKILRGNESGVINSGAEAVNKSYNNISGIYVKPFKNLTYKSGIGVYFSINISNNLNVLTDMFTSDKNAANYYLTGKITSVQNSVMSYTGVAAAVDYMITVNVNVSMYKTDGKIIFRNMGFYSRATYFNYVNPLVARKQEKIAIERVSKRIAQKIVIYIETRKLTS